LCGAKVIEVEKVICPYFKIMSKRIYVPVSDENHEKITKLAEQQNRKVAPMAGILLADGVKLTDQPESTQSYQQRVADEMIKKKEG